MRRLLAWTSEARVRDAATPLTTETHASADDSALWWPPEMFLSADGPGDRCPPTIDVTGHARRLLWGPYVALPPGLWRARAVVDICPDAARRTLAFEFGAEPDYTAVDLIRGVSGLQTVDVEHRMTGEGLAELRLWLRKAAFHGEARFLGAAVERLGDA
jgi:hypothetical protein